MDDNQTTELCKLLEERGVKWKTKSYPSSLLSSEQLTDIYWEAGNAEWRFTERPDGRTYLSLIGRWSDCTPKQAVAATLGEPIIKCRDCRHMHTVRHWPGVNVNECWLHADRESGALGKERTEPDGFCMWAKRKEVD